MQTINELEQILSALQISGEVLTAEPCGNGHINDTYKVTTDENKSYIVQRINDRVFPDIKGLMSNISSVTEYMKKNAAPGFAVLNFHKTRQGEAFTKRESGYFRAYDFVDNVISVETAPTREQLKISGTGFGIFQKLLNGFPSKELTEPIKDFHNTAWRLKNLAGSAKTDSAGRLNEVKAECDFFISRQAYASFAVDRLISGALPLRVTHNDTKLNNILIDEKKGTPKAVIDLDTVMPGSILYDFGDSIRFGANTAAEDEEDLTKVNFSLPHFSAFSEGYLNEVGGILTEEEKECIAFGAILMTYECGMRFLTDYLNGDKYFKIHRANHNLARARTQIKLVKEMEENIRPMNDITKKIL